MHIINKPLWNKQTPLYVACKNGNIEGAWLLLDMGADPYIKCKVSETEEDSVLAVCVRWS